MSDEARSMWKAFITAPENKALLKRYAKSVKEPAPLFESIGEDLGSTNEEVRTSAFCALVAAMPELTNILHERETRQPGWRDGKGKDQQMVNRGSDILSYLHRVLVKEHRFKSGRETPLDYEAALEIPDPTGSVEDRVTKEEVLHRFSNYHWIGLDLGRLSHYNCEDNSATYTPLLRREPIKPKEGEPRQLKERENRGWSLDAARLQALKQYGDALDEVIASPDIPDAEKHDFINKTTSHSVEICKARQKGIQFEESIQRKAQALKKKGEIFSQPPKQEKALQPPDLSEIPLYRGRRGRPREVMPLDFLKTHYGQWLSAFGAEENIVFQDQIRHHDQGLIKGIENQLRAEGEGRKVSDFVKTRSARVDRELENTDPEYLRKAHREASRLEVASKRRELKANRSPKSL